MTDAKQNSTAGIVIMVLVAAGIAASCIGGIVSSGSDGDTNASPLPSTKQAKSLASDMAYATKTQGICYGWDVQFDDNWSYKGGESVGSNQGTDQPLDTSQCDKWVVFHGSVTWTSSTSESNDYGTLSLDSSANLTSALPDSDEQKAAGIDVDALIDWPRDAIETAMEALPLLMSENGAAPAVPAGNDSSAAAEVSAPPSAGNDNLRAHKTSLILGLIGIVGALALLTVGLLSWRRKRAYAAVADIAPMSPAPPGPARPGGGHNGGGPGAGHGPPGQRGQGQRGPGGPGAAPRGGQRGPGPRGGQQRPAQPGTRPGAGQPGREHGDQQRRGQQSPAGGSHTATPDAGATENQPRIGQPPPAPGVHPAAHPPQADPDASSSATGSPAPSHRPERPPQAGPSDQQPPQAAPSGERPPDGPDTSGSTERPPSDPPPRDPWSDPPSSTGQSS